MKVRNPEFNELLKAAFDNARNQIKADGCTGCAFADRDEWVMPCSRCKRNCKDYWRAEPQNEDDE